MEITKERKNHVHTKTVKGAADLEMIFMDKGNVLKGLLKYEVMALYLRKGLDAISKMKKETIDSKWNNEIKTIIRYLRAVNHLAIINKKVPNGTVLFCNEFGQRTLDSATHIYFRCTALNDALKWSHDQDKISEAIHNAASTVLEITKDQLEQKPIMEALKV